MFQIISFLFLVLFAEAQYYRTNNGRVSFESKATLEKIVSVSNNLNGIINPVNNTFTFNVELESFYGFNSELQRNHYQENYVESDKYPKVVFSGKIIEDIDYQKVGSYIVRAKGNFVLHGISINKIITSKLIIHNSNQIRLIASFQLNLSEYNIRIPRIVHKKIAENIKVDVDAILNKKE